MQFHYRREAGPIRAGSSAKVSEHPGELYPRVGFISLTNLSRPATNVVPLSYNKHDTFEQWIKEGKGAIKWTRLSHVGRSPPTPSGSSFMAGLRIFGNFLRTLATPSQSKTWSLTSLKEKLIKESGAKVVCHGRYVAFALSECGGGERILHGNVQEDFTGMELRHNTHPAPASRHAVMVPKQSTGGVSSKWHGGAVTSTTIWITGVCG